MQRAETQTVPWQLAFLGGQLTVFSAVVVMSPEALPALSDLWKDENRQLLEQVPQLKPSAVLMLLLQQLQIWGTLAGVALTLGRAPGAFRYWVTYFLLLISLAGAGLFVFDTIRLELIFSQQATLTADVINWIGDLMRTCIVAALSLAFLFLSPCRDAFPVAADSHSVRWDRVVVLLSLPFLANVAAYWGQERDHHATFDRAQIDKACDSQGASYFCWRGEKHGRFGRARFTPKNGVFLEAMSSAEPRTGRDALLFQFRGQKKSDQARTFSALFVSPDDTPLNRGLYVRPLPAGPLDLFRGQGPWPSFRLWWSDEEDYCLNSRGSFEILELQRSGKTIDKALIRFQLQCTGREDSRLIGKLCLNCQETGSTTESEFPLPLPPREDSPGPFPLAGGLSQVSLEAESLDSLCAGPTESYLCAYKGKSLTDAKGSLHDLSSGRLSTYRDEGWKLRANRVDVEIRPSRGTFLAPGVYFNPSPHRRASRPYIDVGRYSPSCKAKTRKDLFIVEQFEQDAGGEVLRLAVSF